MANPLKGFSNEQLLEELSRRQRIRDERDERAAFQPCDECANFVNWTKASDPPDNYNPCSKGHVMKFRMPEGGDPRPGEWGFYRRVCADRETPAENKNSQ